MSFRTASKIAFWIVNIDFSIHIGKAQTFQEVESSWTVLFKLKDSHLTV